MAKEGACKRAMVYGMSSSFSLKIMMYTVFDLTVFKSLSLRINFFLGAFRAEPGPPLLLLCVTSEEPATSSLALHQL